MPHGASAFGAPPVFCHVLRGGYTQIVYSISLFAARTAGCGRLCSGAASATCPPGRRCVVEELPGADALLERDAARYELILIELEGSPVRPGGGRDAAPPGPPGGAGGFWPGKPHGSCGLSAGGNASVSLCGSRRCPACGRVEPDMAPPLAVNTAAGAAAAALWRDRVSGVYPVMWCITTCQRGPRSAGASGGTAFAGGWPLLQPHPSYVRQPGPGRAGLPMRQMRARPRAPAPGPCGGVLRSPTGQVRAAAKNKKQKHPAALLSQHLGACGGSLCFQQGFFGFQQVLRAYGKTAKPHTIIL